MLNINDVTIVRNICREFMLYNYIKMSNRV